MYLVQIEANSGQPLDPQIAADLRAWIDAEYEHAQFMQSVRESLRQAIRTEARRQHEARVAAFGYKCKDCERSLSPTMEFICAFPPALWESLITGKAADSGDAVAAKINDNVTGMVDWVVQWVAPDFEIPKYRDHWKPRFGNDDAYRNAQCLGDVTVALQNFAMLLSGAFGLLRTAITVTNPGFWANLFKIGLKEIGGISPGGAAVIGVEITIAVERVICVGGRLVVVVAIDLAKIAPSRTVVSPTHGPKKPAGGGQKPKGGVQSGKGAAPNRITGPLSKEARDTLREQARNTWQQRTGRRAIWDGLQVHHRIPLEWSHLFPNAGPNRIANLVGLPNNVHTQVTNAWNAWRRGLGGRMPTQAEVIQQALQIDEQFGEFMRFLP